MNPSIRVVALPRLVACALLGLFVTARFAAAQGSTTQTSTVQTFEAALSHTVGGVPVVKGTAQATLSGSELKVFSAFGGLRQLNSSMISAHLYRGEPSAGGEYVRNLVISFGPAGGFESAFELDEPTKQDLLDGRLFVQVRTESIIPADTLTGKLLVSEPTETVEAKLSQFYQGWPTSRGSVRATLTPNGLRLVGFFNALSSNWTRITLYHGPAGGPEEYVTSLFGISTSDLYAGFDATISLPDGPGGGWYGPLHGGEMSVVIETSRMSDALRGRLLASTNQAPPSSRVSDPSSLQTIVIGGTGGADPEHPDTYLGMVELDRVEDADGDPVAYAWQLSLRPSFNADEVTTTIDLGIDSTRVRLSVARAAALFDTLAAGMHGGIPLETPTTVYHRVITTDGSLYSVGLASQLTLVRGSVTSNDDGPNVPLALRLHGNYPNPFAVTTAVAFDLANPSDVRVDVYNVLGQRVLTMSPGMLPAGESQRVELDGSALPNGNYLYRVTARSMGGAHTAKGVRAATGRMTLIR